MKNGRIISSAVDEAYRLKVLTDVQLLDSAPEPAFDALAALARRLTDTPIALVSLVDAQRQWFKARCGINATENPRDIAFCDHAIRQHDIMIVEDARQDQRFSNNPFVTGEEGIAFYAGVPLLVRGEGDGRLAAIGTLCVIDHVPRILTTAQIEALQELAQIAATLIEGRRLALQAVRHAEERHQVAHQLTYERRKFQQAERMAGLGYWRLNLEDEDLYWSDQVYRIHEIPVSPAPPVNAALDFYPAHDRAMLAAAMVKTMETGVPFDIETDFLAAKGALRRVRSIGELEIVDGKAVAIFGVFQDITERYRMEQILRRSANSDALTGIANRAAFDDVLDAHMATAQGSGHGLTVMLIDLDGFKAVNDAQGHMAGDELLKSVAERLLDPAYADCFVARLGGDEFVLILDGSCDTAALEERAQHVLDDLQRPFVTPECHATISGTIGIARWQPGDMRRDLMRRADQALYAAKNSERGTARFYDTGRTIRSSEATALRKTG